jgi:hypothetical protein
LLKGIWLTLWGATLFLLVPEWGTCQASFHEKIVLRAIDGSAITSESKMPYSPRKTCGACHNYDLITNGYHFQQGRTDGARTIVISDAFDPKVPWNLSSGMYGRH